MSARVQFPPKQVDETDTLKFDFISRLAVGETISSAVTTASVYTGVDATPSGLISGAASISGTVVSQGVVAGIAGTIYALWCTATLSTGRVVMLVGLLAVQDGAV